MTVRDLKKGDFFTLKDIANPTEKQVFIRGEYDKSDKAFCCGRFDDISYSRMLKPNTKVFVDFIF